MNSDENIQPPPGEEPAGGAAAQTGEPAAAPAEPARFVPQDLQVPWSWTDVGLFLVLTLVTMFLLQLVAVRAFAAFGVDMRHIRESSAIQGILVFVTEVPLAAILLTILALQMRVRSKAPAWQTMGWRALPETNVPRPLVVVGLIFSGLFLSFAVSLISSRFEPKANLPIQAYFENRLSAILIMSMAVVVAPVFEETIFRGYLYPVIARSWGVASGIFVTGTLFGLLHSMQLWGGWVQIGLLIGVGIVFTYARAVSKTVLASYLLHVSYNSSIFLAFLIASHGLRQLPSIH